MKDTLKDTLKQLEQLAAFELIIPELEQTLKSALDSFTSTPRHLRDGLSK